MTSHEEAPTLALSVTANEARELRESLSADQRQRVETTVEELLALFGKAHAISILSEFAFADGPLRFSELESSLDIAANTLSARLTELTAVGLLVRQQYDEVPPRVEYEPTPKAVALFPAFGHFHVWAITHELESR